MAYTQTKEFSLASNIYVDMQDTMPSTGSYDDGELIALNDCVGFVVGDIIASQKFAAIVIAHKATALKKTETISTGQTLYWDDTDSKVTAVDSSAGLPVIGYALEDAASADVTVVMYFNGTGKSLT